jgi:hypothetical protein
MFSIKFGAWASSYMNFLGKLGMNWTMVSSVSDICYNCLSQGVII